MGPGTLFAHACVGAWQARRHRDVQAACAVVALLALACVGGIAVADAIGIAIDREHERLRYKFGTLLIVEAGVGTGGEALREIRERVLGLTADPQTSGIEAVSSVYESPLEAHLGLLPLTASGDADVADRGSIAVADDDPYVLPGFGLPSDTRPAFERNAGERCWRFAYVASRDALARSMGVEAHSEAIDRYVGGRTNAPNCGSRQCRHSTTAMASLAGRIRLRHVRSTYSTFMGQTWPHMSLRSTHRSRSRRATGAGSPSRR